ncbi:WD40-repeat-containing domain protein [Glomus cerebriforme]|uniref:WD40-repeat-containing domain protein n=1 Tax=Glomus cerebriforme TaxID=658196 RepID=A0A397TBB0_9GLOM|nr:WD40-repeat-containing domain protein [Glomus cerebriforme]
MRIEEHPACISETGIEERIITLLESPADEGYNDGYEEIKHEIEIPSWITSLSEEQRAEFAFQLLLTLPTPKIAQLHNRLSPLFHRDFLALLPYELAIHILSFLDARTLGRAACVSIQWRKVSSDGTLWRNLFFKNGWTVNTKMVEWYTSNYQLQTPTICSRSNSPFNRAKNPDQSISTQQQLETDDDYELDDIHDDHIEDDQNINSSNEKLQSFHYPSTNQISLLPKENDGCGSQQEDLNLDIWNGVLSHSRTTISRNSINIPSAIPSTSLSTVSAPISDRSSSIDKHFINSAHSTSLLHHPTEQLPSPPLPSHYLFPPSAYIPYNLPILPMHQNESGQPAINWKYLYHQRSLLEHHWHKGIYSIRKLPGHTESIYCIQFDEHKIISGSRDDTIKVWDIKTGYCIRTYRGHRQSVLCLQYDDNLIVSGSSDTTIIIWNLATGEIIRTLEGHSESVLNLRFNDNHIVSCSKDRTVRIWNRETGVCLRVLCGHRAAVNAIQFKDGCVVSASGDRTIKLWSLVSGQCLRTFDGHSRGIACIQFDGNIIISGSSDKTIKVFDVHTGACLSTLVGHTDLVRTLQFDKNRIVSGSYDETLRVWDLKTGELQSNLIHGHTSRIFKLQFNTTKIISCSQDQKIIIWDFAHNVDTTFLV